MAENDELQGQPGEEIRLPDTTYRPGCNKLDCFNWLKDLPDSINENEIIEIRFKNTRKGFFRNVNNLRLEIGDIVAVEQSVFEIERIIKNGGYLIVSVSKFWYNIGFNQMLFCYRDWKYMESVEIHYNFKEIKENKNNHVSTSKYFLFYKKI